MANDQSRKGYGWQDTPGEMTQRGQHHPDMQRPEVTPGNYDERSVKPWRDPQARSHAPREVRNAHDEQHDYDPDNIEFIPSSYGGRFERRDLMYARDAQPGGHGMDTHRSWNSWERNPPGIAERQIPARGGYRGKGPKGYQPSDARLKERLDEAFYDDDMLDASEIEVQVKDGEVTLQGAVESREDRQRAEWLVSRVAGEHTHIHNSLRIQSH